MSQNTRQEALIQMRGRYARAGRKYKSQRVTERVELFGYHRKAALRALRPVLAGPRAPFARGRPKESHADQLLAPLQAIWLASLPPCGARLKATLPDWLPACEADHRRLDPDARQALLDASRATLDRLLFPARIAHRRRAATRPGSLPCAQIPIHPEWTGSGPGFLAMDTVALCGGTRDDRHGWRFDAVYIPTPLERLARPAQPPRGPCVRAAGRRARPPALRASE